MLLGVSRQTVTKWEAEKSNPEMDKLIDMCRIFDCTLDDLVRGDLTGRPCETVTAVASSAPVDVCGYDEHMRAYARSVATGAAAVILGVSAGVLFAETDLLPVLNEAIFFVALLAAVLAEGKTELSGAAIEPEIMDLVSVLQKMGAIISVDVDRTFRIEGVKELKGYTHTSLTDRIEAASWASAALATHGDIFVKGATQPEMMTFLNVFRKIGGEFDITDKGIRFWHPGGDLKPVAIETDVHPGFMTDWQQPLVVALTQANGLSIVHETVYENRFGFTKPLVQMGATIQLYRECLGSLPCRFQQRNYKHSAVIFGPTPLTGRDIDVPDLRGGFSHLIAALAAKGPSNVQGISLIDRGYADFRGKWRLSAQISTDSLRLVR